MTKNLPHPTPRDPLTPVSHSHVPPNTRSRAATELATYAASGRLAMQVCNECENVTYPPRDLCPVCWGELTWDEIPAGGEVLAKTTLTSSTDLYFRSHMPWRIGTIKLDAGPTCFAHLHSSLEVGDKVKMKLKLDRGANAVLVALPETGSDSLNEDQKLREFGASPVNRRILISDGRGALGQALAKSFLKAGARSVYLGNSDMNKFFHGKEEMEDLKKVTIVPLDLEDTASVHRLASELGGQVDIVVNTAGFVRFGGVMDVNLHNLKSSLDINVMGLARLAEAFGPALASRAADRDYSAIAFVDVASVYGLTGGAQQASNSAGNAARIALLNVLRSELAKSGIRVMSVLTGPIDDSWHQTISLPKVNESRIASSVLSALEEGRELTVVGDVANSIYSRWLANPLLAVREENK